MKILFLVTALSTDIGINKEKLLHVLKELIVLLDFQTNSNDSTTKTNQLTVSNIFIQA